MQDSFQVERLGVDRDSSVQRGGARSIEAISAVFTNRRISHASAYRLPYRW
jgi:hypothetical protein